MERFLYGFLVLIFSGHCFATSQVILKQPHFAIKGPPQINRSFSVELKNQKVDLSSYIQQAESLLNHSDYENMFFIKSVFGTYVKDEVTVLCNELPSSQKQLCLENLETSILETQARWTRLQNSKMLYPHDYYPLGNLPESILNEGMDTLQSHCLNACYDISVMKILMYGLEHQYNHVVSLLKDRRIDCLRSLIRNMRREINKYHRTSDCTLETNQNKSICKEDFSNHYRVMNQRALFFEGLLASKLDSIRPFNLTAQKVNLQTDNFTQTQQKSNKKVRDQWSCYEYDIGEERTLFFPSMQFSLGNFNLFQSFAHYKVKRATDRLYKVFIALDFSSWEFNSPRLNHGLHKYVLDKVRGCMDEAHPHLLGPNGKMLEIVIEDAKESNSCTPKHSIKIRSLAYTGDASSHNYPIDIQCPLITHEILHLLGLSDEYPFQRGIQRIFPLITHEILHLLGLSDEYSFQREIQRIFHLNNIFSLFDCRVVHKDSVMNSGLSRWDKAVNSPSNSQPYNIGSLLNSKHFKAILYGNCSERNDVSLFRECSRLSFQDSRIHPNCLAQKFYCEQQDVLGRNIFYKSFYKESHSDHYEVN